MGTLFQKALNFKEYFSIGLFVAVCLFTENWNKTGKITAKMCFLFLFYCDSLYIKCIIQPFPMV